MNIYTKTKNKWILFSLCGEIILEKVYFKLIIVLKSSERKIQLHKKHKWIKQFKI